jgi:sec-independent protein translocase protein TatA
MFGMGAQELLIIFAIVFLLFGAKKLPGLASSLGGAVHNFKKSLKGAQEEEEAEARRAMEAKSLAARSGDPVPVPSAVSDTSKV